MKLGILSSSKRFIVFAVSTFLNDIKEILDMGSFILLKGLKFGFTVLILISSFSDFKNSLILLNSSVVELESPLKA